MNFLLRLRRVAGALCVSAIVGCSGSDSTEPAPVPAALVAVSGGGEPQHATVGTRVAQPPSVRVLSTTGAPMSGVQVSFIVTAGGGTIAAARTTTNAEGIAAVDRWTLGTVAGQNTLTASVSGLSSVLFQAVANPGPPVTLQPFGSGQSGTAGSQLPLPVGAVVRDAFGNAVSGVTLAFDPVAGSVSESAVATDSDGRAEALWTLGPQTGQHSLAIAVADAGIEHVITASASAGAPAQLILVDDGGTGVVGTNLFPTPSVIVADAHGNGLPGITVRFTASAGSLLVAETTSDADGRAWPVRWILGTVAGPQWIDAEAENGALTARLGATAVAGHPTQITLLSPSNVSALVEQPIDGAIRVRVTDTYGNEAPNVRVLTLLDGGGSIHPAVVVTQADGIAQLTWTLGPNEGEQRLTVALDFAGTGAIIVTASATIIPLQAKQVAVSWNAAHCAVKLDEEIVCWGYNTQGSIGDGTPANRVLPVRVAGPQRKWASVSTGEFHTCGITTAGEPYCWGVGGLIGDGGTESRYSPAPVSGGHVFQSISAGQGLTCGTKSDGSLWCWGSDWTTTRREPFRVGENFDADFLSASVGTRRAGGLMSIPGSLDPVPYLWSAEILSGVPPDLWWTSPLVELSLGFLFECGRDEAGKVFCRGVNDHGQLGSEGWPSNPQPITSSLRFTTVSAGLAHACAVAVDGDAYCWGHNAGGQLGDGTTTSRALPQRAHAPAGVKFSSIAAGRFGTCAIATNADVYCWGGGIHGLVPTPRRMRAE